ncbi:hypothetical protein NFI96_028570, partial [Prochilodus magdalenae]
GGEEFSYGAMVFFAFFICVGAFLFINLKISVLLANLQSMAEEHNRPPEEPSTVEGLTNLEDVLASADATRETPLTDFDNLTIETLENALLIGKYMGTVKTDLEGLYEELERIYEEVTTVPENRKHELEWMMESQAAVRLEDDILRSEVFSGRTGDILTTLMNLDEAHIIDSAVDGPEVYSYGMLRAVMSSALCVLLLFSALWTLSLCGTRHFHLVNEQKTWTEAQSYCREKFTDLATIESQQEMDALIAVLNGTGEHSWIGLRQTVPPNSRNWTWSDGSNFSYTYWTTGDPNGGVGDNCVQLLNGPEYRWNDAGCKWPNPFICYEELPLILINQNKTWREALWYCRENHVDLVSVHNATIQRWVEVITKHASTANVWVGLRHTCAQSFWFWVSGWSICYQNWAPGNGTGVEDCSGGERTGAVQSGSKQWVSLPETQTLNFICSLTEGNGEGGGRGGRGLLVMPTSPPLGSLTAVARVRGGALRLVGRHVSQSPP